MNFYILISLLVMSSIIHAKDDSYTCSYPGYLQGKPVMIKVEVKNRKATIGDEAYTVISNTAHGLVLARSFAYDKSNIGMFGIVIDKKTLLFTRGNILSGETSSKNVEGKCLKN